MGYKVDLYLEDGSSKKGISKQVDQEYLQGKTIRDIVEDVLDTAKGENKLIAGTIRTLYGGGDIDIYEGTDNRPIELGDLVVKTVREVEEAGEKKGKLHLIVQGSEIIG